MLLLLKIVLIVFAIFTALGIACAVRLASRREGGIGVPEFKHPRRVDPYSSAFGDVPYTGFSARQLGDVAPPPQTLDALNRSFGSRANFILSTSDQPLVYGAGMRRRHIDLTSAGALQRNAAGERQVPSWTLAGRTGGFR